MEDQSPQQESQMSPSAPENRNDGPTPQQAPEPPATPPGGDEHDLRELNTSRTLATVATIAGPVSFIVGGVLLSSVAVVCSILALVKVRRIAKPESPHAGYANIVKQTAIMGIFISCVALVLNIIGIAAMLPALMDAVNSGDYSAILGDAAGDVQATSDMPSGGTGGAWG